MLNTELCGVELIKKTSTMKKEIKTEILIKASPQIVWSILTDFENYPHWNPFIKSIKGKVAVGQNIKVRIEPPDAMGMTFKPKVLTFDENKEFKWLGHLFIKGLFDGEHSFKLIENPNGTTTFIHSEKFKGILVPLFQKQLDNNTIKGFEAMNNKLKDLVELTNAF